MLPTLFIFFAALLLVVRGATFATRYASLLAESFTLSRYTVGFIVVAIISILPETFIALTAGLRGESAFGFGMLLGSNVADLTIVVAGIIFLARHSLKVECRILRSHVLYPFLLLLPLVLGFDGQLTRSEGVALIIAGAVFYYLALRRGREENQGHVRRGDRVRNTIFLLGSMGLLLLGAHFVVSSATTLAHAWGISPVLIGMLVVGLGTTMPEFFFSLKALKQNDDALAIGDILGTVLADATIVVGLLALIAPFTFPKTIIYVAGVFMVASAFILFSFMRSGRTVTGKEAFALLIFWLTFVFVESIVNI
jgi:cation:H+ antiporter